MRVKPLVSAANVLASEKKLHHLLNRRLSGKHKIDDHILCCCGADANLLINYCRRAAQGYLLRYSQPMPVEQLLQQVCDLKQGYTQYGGT